MSLEIKQVSSPRDNGRWNWSIWLEGPADELDQVEFVRYRLHPTFPSPVQDVTNRASKFRLDASGWGEFMIRVEIHRSATVDERQHWLQLGAPGAAVDPNAEPVPRKDTIFISSGVADQPFADALRHALRQQGSDVVTNEDLPLVKAAVESPAADPLSQADRAIIVISGQPNSSVRHDLNRALDRGLEVTAIGLGPEAFSGLEAGGYKVHHFIEIDQAEDPDEMAARAVAQIETE